MRKRKFSKANLLYVFSLVLGVTIVVMGFSVTNNAKKELEKQAEVRQETQQAEVKKESTVVSKPAEKVVKEEIVEEEVTARTATEEVEQEDEFLPTLENQILVKPTDGEISVPFTGSSLVYSEMFDEWCVHKGVHFGAKQSAQVRAVANGVVKSVYKDNRMGLTIVLEHGDFTTIYANLSTDELVSEGDKVEGGKVISGVNKSVDGKEYLHFELIYKGENINPEPLFQ